MTLTWAALKVAALDCLRVHRLEMEELVILKSSELESRPSLTSKGSVASPFWTFLPLHQFRFL